MVSGLVHCAISALLRWASEPERCADWDHRRSAGVDGVDDLGVVDALEVDRGDPEVAVAELALDDGQLDALVGNLDGMRVTQLMGCEAAPHAGGRGSASQVGAHGCR
jgi:hypothetical protein